MNPLISVVIPTYNRFHLIGETLDSVIAQTYNNWECIVVDDGSTDYTQELMEYYVRKDSRIMYYQRPVDRQKGANACRNYGLEISNGDFINWMDSDDIMHPTKLYAQINILKKSKGNFCVCQSVGFQNLKQKSVETKIEEIHSYNLPYDYMVGNIRFFTPSPLWKKSFLEENNYSFDESLQAAQEWEFHCRILLKFSRYEILNETLVYLRRHKANISNQGQEKLLKDYFNAHLKVYNLYKPNSIFTVEFEEYFSQYFKRSYRQALRWNNVKLAGKILRESILKNQKVSRTIKVQYLLALGSYCLFKRGYIFLKN